MRAEERENLKYTRGQENPIDTEEKIMFSLLPPPPKNDIRKNLLDIGWDVGNISLELQKKGYEVTELIFQK